MMIDMLKKVLWALLIIAAGILVITMVKNAIPSYSSLEEYIYAGNPSDKIIRELDLEQQGAYYIKEGVEGRYYFTDNSIVFYTGTDPENPPTFYIDGTWYLAKPSKTPSSDKSVKEHVEDGIDDLNLKEQEGHYTRAKYEGNYYLLADGSIFYAGGPDASGKYFFPQFYVNGDWVRAMASATVADGETFDVY